MIVIYYLNMEINKNLADSDSKRINATNNKVKLDDPNMIPIFFVVILIIIIVIFFTKTNNTNKII